MDLSANFKLHVSSTKAIEDDFFQLPKLQVLSLNELSPSIPISEKIEQQTRLRRYGTEDTLSNFGVAEFLGIFYFLFLTFLFTFLIFTQHLYFEKQVKNKSFQF